MPAVNTRGEGSTAAAAQIFGEQTIPIRKKNKTKTNRKIYLRLLLLLFKKKSSFTIVVDVQRSVANYGFAWFPQAHYLKYYEYFDSNVFLSDVFIEDKNPLWNTVIRIFYVS